MLAIEPIREGRVYHWFIGQIMERDSSDRKFYVSWMNLLDEKRQDGHYPDVLQSLEEHGFIRPLNADTECGQLQLSDGHHRLAAAIDLGMEVVPVYVSWENVISDDSGCWEAGDPVPTDPRVGRADW
ncbi:ParB-like nuclease domain protein [Microbacterium phage Katzastrophic]|uniref:ParB-like nuclease domain protein n=1 Tax=Microbacterium phage Katzastrophic TaxID=2912654 RepID=UPI00243196F2|nr:ParB-like nuclease domain protein [Microbacterium phage Katzastrophic]UKH48484.1 ParB-like nuclease domain protein [Microbacterium phage Katzastrophic]